MSFMWALAVLALYTSATSAARVVRPATVSFPLFVGVIDVRTVPSANDTHAPATIEAKGVARRAAGYPAAPQLSVRPIERLAAVTPGAAGVSGGATPPLSFTAAPALREGRRLTPRGSVAAIPTTPAPGVRQRRLLQATVAPRQAARRRAAATRGGFTAAAPSGRYAGGGGGAAASLAASDERAVHVTGGALAIYALSPHGGGRNGTLALLRLQDLFDPVGSSNCRDGVYDATAAYDPHARRFYVASACGGTGSALLAVSASAEPAAAWYLYNLNADGIGTRLACTNGEAALADYPRLQFNRDAIAVSLHSWCPTPGGAAGSQGAGATLLVLPKGALSRGEVRVSYPVFTSHEVARAAGGAAEARAVAQLEPAAPQHEEDVTQGSMYFLADPVVPRGQPRSSFLLIAVVNTGAMWGFADASAASNTVSPYLVATMVERGADAPAPAEGAVLRQPEGAPALEMTRMPAGFWPGRAAWSSGKVWTVEEVAADSDARMPTVAWTVAEPSLQVPAAGECASTAAWGDGFDFAHDVSSEFGAAVQPAWEAFVERAVNASGLVRQAQAVYGARLAAVASRSGSGGLALAAASEADVELAEQLSRTDVSPFFVPVKDIPRTSAASSAAPGELSATAVYGQHGGRGGFEGWSCWTCRPGTAGFVSAASAYDFGASPGRSGFNLYGGTGYGQFPGGMVAGDNGWRLGGWGGGPFGNFGPGPYGGGYGTGGWAGGYFGGFFSGSNVGGVNWGSACQIMCQRAWLGTGGVYGWGTGLAPGGWGPFGFLPFGLGSPGGGWGSTLGNFFGRRRLAHAGGAGVEADGSAGEEEQEDAEQDSPEGEQAVTLTPSGPSAAVAPTTIDAAAVAAAAAASDGVLAAQVSASGAMQPTCVAAAAVCAAAARATCPAGSEPAITLSAAVVQRGVLGPDVAGFLALAAPSLAMSRDGAMLVVATYSGTGRVRGSSAMAYPGVASIVVTPGGGQPTLRVEQRGASVLSQDAVRAAGVWPVPPAVAVQAGGSAIYVTAEKMPGTSADPWVSILEA